MSQREIKFRAWDGSRMLKHSYSSNKEVWDKSREEFDSEIASLMDKSEYSKYVGSFHRQAIKRFVSEQAVKYYNLGIQESSKNIDERLKSLRYKNFDGRLDYELGLEKAQRIIEKTGEDRMIENAKFKDNAMEKFLAKHNLPMDREKLEKEGYKVKMTEHFKGLEPTQITFELIKLVDSETFYQDN